MAIALPLEYPKVVKLAIDVSRTVDRKKFRPNCDVWIQRIRRPHRNYYCTGSFAGCLMFSEHLYPVTKQLLWTSIDEVLPDYSEYIDRSLRSLDFLSSGDVALSIINHHRRPYTVPITSLPDYIPLSVKFKHNRFKDWNEFDMHIAEIEELLPILKHYYKEKGQLNGKV